jgi:hypothetical protein
MTRRPPKLRRGPAPENWIAKPFKAGLIAPGAFAPEPKRAPGFISGVYIDGKFKAVADLLPNGRKGR